MSRGILGHQRIAIVRVGWEVRGLISCDFSVSLTPLPARIELLAIFVLYIFVFSFPPKKNASLVAVYPLLSGYIGRRLTTSLEVLPGADYAGVCVVTLLQSRGCS